VSRVAVASSVALTKGIAGKTIVCKVNNGESQTHFTSASTGIEGDGRSDPAQDSARGAVSLWLLNCHAERA
jgi:hypothetical protein